MEIRCMTISYAKRKAKETNKRELIIKDTLDKLDHIICNNADLTNIGQELKQYENLKKELYLNIFSILKKGILAGK